MVRKLGMEKEERKRERKRIKGGGGCGCGCDGHIECVKEGCAADFEIYASRRKLDETTA